MSVEIFEVDNKKKLKVFVDLPWFIYQHDPLWVPPLKIGVYALLNPKHPFYQNAEIKMWLAYKDQQPVGRVAAIINHAYNQFHQDRTGFFGFFECVEDFNVAQALMEKVHFFLSHKGMDSIEGPVNPSTNYECGLLVAGKADPPQIMMTYNPSYYLPLLENQGFQKAKDLLAYRLDADTQLPRLLKLAVERSSRSERIKLRPLNFKKWDREIDTILEIYNNAWEKNWGFVPFSESEFRQLANELKMIADPKLIMIAEVNGDAAGFIIALPDYHQVFKQIPNGKLFFTGIFKLLRAKKYINRLRVLTIGVKQKYRSLSLAPLLIQGIRDYLDRDPKKRYREVEQSWVLEDNEPMNRPLRLMGADPYKTYRILRKSLKPEGSPHQQGPNPATKVVNHGH
jgi:hypothetical protein